MLRNSVSCLFKLNIILWLNNPCSKLFMSILVIFFVDLYHDLLAILSLLNIYIVSNYLQL